MSDPAIIAVERLHKSYSTPAGRIEALVDLSFEVFDGEFVSIVGPSGCGKSTLLLALGGLVPITAGAVRFEGKPVESPTTAMGLVFQKPVLLPWRTVRENALLAADAQGHERKRYDAQASALLRMVGLEEFERAYPHQLSGGMQQRVAIVRALVHDPRVLLMDEPFAALDAITRDHMGLELQRIWQQSGKTIVLVTHSIPEAVFLSDRVLLLTQRPGHLAAVVDVPIPRPRTLATTASPEFTSLVLRVRGLLEEQGPPPSTRASGEADTNKEDRR
jgi:NitT/TauT family transport system ATP-binding protein